MGFIQEINSLDIDIIIRLTGDRFHRKLLDIDNGDGIFAAVICSTDSTDILDEIFLGIYLLHMEPTGGKFLGCLCQQIEAVNDKIKLRDLALLLVVVSQIADIMECQCSFSTALCVPDDTVLCALAQLLLDGKGGEELRVAHYMLLERLNPVFVGSFHIGKAIVQKHKKALVRKQGCEDPVGGRQFAQVRDIFICALYRHKVVIFQDEVCFGIVDRGNGGMDKRIFLTETIEKQFLITAGRIESSLDRFDIRIIVLHVVGEHHQLRDVNKTAKNLS